MKHPNLSLIDCLKAARQNTHTQMYRSCFGLPWWPNGYINALYGLKLVMYETIFAICHHCNCMILARCGVIWQAKFTCTPNLSQFQISSKFLESFIIHHDSMCFTYVYIRYQNYLNKTDLHGVTSIP